ncbi:DUF6173 family protein [Pseudotabrizicola sp. 4114]|uniref:DUF6173 family protein n=1 Tax=Pseudotabrizicola sp. 4114 TaxID=2817731 RepID=UPI0028591819|nr:hypothetical protein [Pseudorhodobacter sp. 4114]
MAKPTGNKTKAVAPVVTENLPTPAPAAKPKTEAEWAYERVILYLRNFEAQLDNAHEVALGFTGSDAGILQIEGLGFYDPDILTFYGIDEDGQKTQLIQHVSQLNVILRAVPKRRPAEPPRRIGFRLPSGWRGGESGDGSA